MSCDVIMVMLYRQVFWAVKLQKMLYIISATFTATTWTNNCQIQSITCKINISASWHNTCILEYNLLEHIYIYTYFAVLFKLCIWAPIVSWGLLLTWKTAECRQSKNAPKSKVTKRTHFYRDRSHSHVSTDDIVNRNKTHQNVFATASTKPRQFW